MPRHRGRGLRIAIVLGLIAALAGLNLYQWITRPAPALGPIVARPTRPPRPQTGPVSEEQAVADRYHEWFYNNPDITWANSTWAGVAAMQNPNDAWIHQEIIGEVKPDFIIEAGTAYGGSAILWAMVLQQVNPAGRVITIDITDLTDRARKVPIWAERVDFILGSSTDPKIVADLTERVKGRRVMVILDTDHSKAHVLNELKAYSPLVPVGSYLIVQDTNTNGHPVFAHSGPGPMEALDEFLATSKDFESDRGRERFLFTMHPKGYLKRIK